MKRYYIPTSSLNFNNILSSESISPKSFYERRGFGYSSWFDVEENNIADAIILYEVPHEFVRPKSDIEDHPMLVEIVTDEEFTSFINGVYYSQQTIYINPWQTKFIFFSEKVRTTVLSMSDSSLETKMVRLYRQQMAVEHFEGEYPSIGNIKILPDSSSPKNIEKDVYINKMKGLLYGYYIGAYLSMPAEQVKKLTVLREIQNIFNSVISSYDKTISKQQSVRFKELFLYLEREHPLYVQLYNVLKIDDLVDKVYTIFEQYSNEIRTSNSVMRDLLSEKNPNPALKWIKTEIDNLNRSIKGNLLSTNEEQIVVSSSSVTSQKAIKDEDLGNLYLVWVNSVFVSSQYNGKISPIKAPLSDEITKKAKEILGDKWETSSIRTYLNQLRRHIRGEEFNQEWNNGLLSSMAAVLLKGDDWETLLRFMQDKGMNDYRIAYSIYGILNGFANLTRDFTDLLINQDSNYVADVYKEFYGQLLGKEISDNIEILITSKDSVQSVPNMEWFNSIQKCAEKTFKKDMNRNRNKRLEDINKISEQSSSIDEFFKKLAEIWKTPKTGKPNKAWHELKQCYENSVNIDTPQREEETVIIQRDLFDNSQYNSEAQSPILKNMNAKNNESVIYDDFAYKHIECCTFLGTNNSLIVSLFNDFQRSYRSGYYYKNQNQYRRNNSDFIDHFCRWCLSQKNKKALIWNQDNRNMIEQLKQYLLEIYND